MRLTYNLALVLTFIAFVLRLAYAQSSHPFIDEFTTVLAAQTILDRGIPILPSGLFYEHGLLFSYLDAPFVALAGRPPIFIIARLPSILIGTALVPLLYALGRRWFSPWVGLGAALLLTFSPEAIVWAGRARMYALAQLLVLGLVFYAFKGVKSNITARHQTTRFRWLALLILLAALLTQLAVILFVPALLMAMFVVKWLSLPSEDRRISWSLLPLNWPEWIGLGAVVGLGLLVKRLGQPLGTAQLGSNEAGNALGALWNTVAYQAGLVINYSETMKFLGRQFGVPHNIWLSIIALVGLAAFIMMAVRDRKTAQRNLPYIFIWLIFGLTVLEMLTFLKPFRRNPRYLVMAMPIFYLIASAGLSHIHSLIAGFGKGVGRRERRKLPSLTPYALLLTPIIALHATGLWQSLNVAYRTPEPAYDRAFQFVADQQSPGDAILTMNPSAAALYLEQVDFFAMQSDAEQFLLNRDTAPVDRWLGTPWIGTTADLTEVLNTHDDAWFIIDTIRLPVYYRGDWLAFLDTQMDLAWADDEALVYHTKRNRSPLPTEPDTKITVNLDNQIALRGYTADITPPTDEAEGAYQLTLFWQALAEIPHSYTIFVHIQDQTAATVAQRDSLPLDGAYPTTQWQLTETIIDPHQIPLPAKLLSGEYQVWIGMYRLETLIRLPINRDEDIGNISDHAIRLDQFMIP